MGRALSVTAVRVCSAAGLAAALVAVASMQARAQQRLPPELTLTWQAPPHCPGAPEAHAALAARLQPTADDDLPELSIDARVVEVSQAPGALAGRQGFRLELRFDGDREGERSLSAADCADLPRAAAVLIQLVIQEPPPPPADEAPAPDEALEASEASDALDAPDEATTSDAEVAPSMRFAVGPSLVLDVGALPKPAAGIGATARVAWAALELGADGAYFPGTREQLEAGSPARVEMSLWELGTLGCIALLRRHVRLGPCAGLAVVRMTGASHAVLQEASPAQTVLAARLGGALQWSFLGPLALRLDLGAVVPLVRSAWRVRDYGYAHRPAPLAGRVALSLLVLP